jgi:hypothetical protein
MTDIDIWNMALARIGARYGISDIDEDSPEARACALFWPSVRKSALRRHPWCFAMVRQALAVHVSSPLTSDWGYSYSLPVNCLRVIRLATGAPFEVAGRNLHTDDAAAEAYFIDEDCDPSSYDPCFVEAASLHLSSSLAMPLTNDRQILANMEALMSRYRPEAMALDAGEGRRERVADASWIQERGG